MKVLLVDDHAVVRDGLHRVLSQADDIEEIAEAASLAEALKVDIDPDVTVADLHLGDASGVDVVVTLARRHPRARILVLTMADAPALVESVLASGAAGYLTKTAASAEVLNAIRRVAAGDEYLQPDLGVAMARGATMRSNTKLSGRELEVLRLIALGHTHAEIAAIVSVSQRTVEAHRASIADKLRCRSRADLVRAAIDLRLVDFR